MKRAIPLIAIFALAGCATPEVRLRTALADGGLSQRQSSCMAQRMVDKLSLLQLRRMASLKNLETERASNMSFDRFLHNVRALNDPEILSVTSRAALGCAISG